MNSLHSEEETSPKMEFNLYKLCKSQISTVRNLKAHNMTPSRISLHENMCMCAHRVSKGQNLETRDNVLTSKQGES